MANLIALGTPLRFVTSFSEPYGDTMKSDGSGAAASALNCLLLSNHWPSSLPEAPY